MASWSRNDKSGAAMTANEVAGQPGRVRLGEEASRFNLRQPACLRQKSFLLARILFSRAAAESRCPARLGGEEGIRTLDTALDRITV